MCTLKWNHEQNGVYHKHIPYNWGNRFPKGELMEYWQQMVSLTLPDPHKCSPYIDIPSSVHVFLGYYFSPYMKYTKNIHSVQCTVGSNFFFFSAKLPTFLFKKNDSSRVRTTAFSSSRFGVRVSVVSNIFTIYP